MWSRQVSRWLLAAVLFLSFPALAFADTVQGRVAAAGTSALDMTVYDGQGRPYPNALHLKVDRYTRLDGVSSPTLLRQQDPVSVQVSQEETGLWRADSISLLQESGAAPRASAPPSPSLRGALGNPVVRNGLMGAATGAIASSASGGKAGKGALIGAGVGILGGLLLDSSSRRSQSSQAGASSQEDTRE